MQKYNSLELQPEQYDAIRVNQSKNGTSFNEHRYGSRRNLFVKNRLIASTSLTSSIDLGELSNAHFVSFLGAFNRNLYLQINQDQELLNLKIDFKDPSRDKNLKLWNSLPNGTFFYNMDLSSAYWQIAHRLGYIPTKFYEKYQHLEEYKQAKRYCISFLARTNKMEYSDRPSISCDISPLQRIYDNIRNELYRCIKYARKGAENWIEYNIDGVSVLAKDIPTVKTNLKDLSLDFKINECLKVSDTEYSYKGKLRKFTRNMAKIAV